MEEALKCLNIVPKFLAKRSNVMWNILLAMVKEAKEVAGNILIIKAVCLQMEYKRQTEITVHN